jgi:hypothetical protein
MPAESLNSEHNEDHQGSSRECAHEHECTKEAYRVVVVQEKLLQGIHCRYLRVGHNRPMRSQ